MNEQGSSCNTAPPDELLWDDAKLEVISAEPSPKTPFIENLNKSNRTVDLENFNFENDVKSWVDYILPLFHPRTVTVIKKYLHNCTQQPFDIFTCGRDLWTTEQFSDDFSNRIRLYVEECDLMQGFQVYIYTIYYFIICYIFYVKIIIYILLT